MRFFLLVLMLLLCSCSRFTYNENTGDFIYWRLGDQRIAALEVDKREEGVLKMKLEGQQSDAQALSEAVKLMGMAVK